MNDPNTIGIALIAVAVGAFMLRVVGSRRPELRVWTTVASLAMFGILVVAIGFFLSSIIAAYLDWLPD